MYYYVYCRTPVLEGSHTKDPERLRLDFYKNWSIAIRVYQLIIYFSRFGSFFYHQIRHSRRYRYRYRHKEHSR